MLQYWPGFCKQITPTAFPSLSSGQVASSLDGIYIFRFVQKLIGDLPWPSWTTPPHTPNLNNDKILLDHSVELHGDSVVTDEVSIRGTHAEEDHGGERIGGPPQGFCYFSEHSLASIMSNMHANTSRAPRFSERSSTLQPPAQICVQRARSQSQCAAENPQNAELSTNHCGASALTAWGASAPFHPIGECLGVHIICI